MHAYRTVLCLVAEEVVNTKQIFKGNVLEVKRLGTVKVKEDLEKSEKIERKMFRGLSFTV